MSKICSKIPATNWNKNLLCCDICHFVPLFEVTDTLNSIEIYSFLLKNCACSHCKFLQFSSIFFFPTFYGYAQCVTAFDGGSAATIIMQFDKSLQQQNELNYSYANAVSLYGVVFLGWGLQKLQTQIYLVLGVLVLEAIWHCTCSSQLASCMAKVSEATGKQSYVQIRQLL